MSSRQLRKLQQQREIERAKSLKLQDVQGGGSEDDEQEELSIKKPSLFANLAALEDDEDQEQDSDPSEGPGEEKAERLPDNESGIPASAERKPKIPKKKKKKSKKSKGAEQINQGLRSLIPDSDGHPDEIDAALHELSLKGGEKSANAAPSSIIVDPEYERVCTLLGINTKHLKVANEMRNLFGRTAVENHDDAGGQIPRGARRRQRTVQQQVDLETALKGHHAPGKGLPELTLRRNIFVQGKDDWPRATTGGLTMEIVDDLRDVDGTVEFRFVHDQAYERVQQQFNLFVEMGDPQNLIELLQRNPYHVSLLLQVSKIAKDQTDHALSSDLVERALFTFGRAATSLFATKLSQGKARLDFARPENRELWLAGYQYIRSLVMKGTYRTALEWAKLLLALDPEQDPYCMLLMTHHLALRAFESQFVLDTGESTLLKTWSSHALHNSPSSALAAMQLRDGVRGRSLLQNSIQHLPWLFCKLFQELNLENPPPSIWGVVPRTDAEKLFSESYIRQTKDLWNAPEMTSLLMEVAHATEKLDDHDLPIMYNSEITLDVARFIYLDNTPALMALVPSKLLHRIPNSDSDPLPPDENIFSWDSQRAAFSRGASSRGIEGAFGDHFDPVAALRALIPGWADQRPAVNGRAITDNELRELLETDMDRDDAGAADEDSENDSEPESAASTARRLYQFLFGGGPQVQTEEAQDEDTSTSNASNPDQ